MTNNKKDKTAHFGKTYALAVALALGVFGGGADTAQADDYHRNHYHRGYSEHQRTERVVVYRPYAESYGESYYDPYYRPIAYRRVYMNPASRYDIGDFLPEYAECREPARAVVAALPPVDRGTRYVQLDKNIYLISEASRRILDAVVLVSAVR